MIALEFYQRRRRSRNNETRASNSAHINLDPCIYSIHSNLETIDQRPPSYSVNYGFNEASSQPPKYEELIGINITQSNSKSNELSKV